MAAAVPVAAAEFRVNHYRTGLQDLARVARVNGAQFVVVWRSYGQDGSEGGIYGRRYNEVGAEQGIAFRINKFKAGDQIDPAVVGLAGGGFVAVWASWARDGEQYGIYGQRYDADWQSVGGEFRINRTGAGSQEKPAIAALPDGGFVVVWQSLGQDGSDYGIYGQRFTGAALKVGKEFWVNKFKTGTQQKPAVAVLADGSFVVVWESWSQVPGGGIDVFGQRFTAAGERIGKEFRVNEVSANDQFEPRIAALVGGGFVVVWTGPHLLPEEGLNIFMQVYAADGSKAGGVSNTACAEGSVPDTTPDVAGLGGGGFVVAWACDGADGSGLGVYGRRFFANGAPVGKRFRINGKTLQNQGRPSVAALAGDSFVVVWESNYPDGGLPDVFGRAFLD